MILDELLKFSDGQALTGGTPAVGTNTVALGSVRRNLGTGRPLYLVVNIITQTGGDAADTLDIELRGDTVEPVDASSAVIAAYPQITGVANFASGAQFVIQVPPNAADYAFISAYFTLSATAAATVDAYLTDNPGYDHTTYPDATEGVTV